MPVWAGYGVIFAYIFSLIFVMGPLVQRASDLETSRKSIHTMLFMVWCFLDLFFRGTVHQIVIPVCFIVLNALSHRFRLFKSVEREEEDHPGTVYFAIAVTAVMTLCFFLPAFYYPSGIAVFCLTFGDGFAAMLGHASRSRKIFESKSLVGTLACFAVSSLAVWIFALVYRQPLGLPQALTIGALCAILELTGHGLDNFTIVFGTALLSYGLLSFPEAPVLPCALLAIGVFLVVFFSRAITYYGALLSMGIVFVFSFFGGAFGTVFLLGTYFCIFFVSVYKYKVLRRPKRGRGRGLLQILINGGLGTLFMLYYGLSGERGALLVSVAAIGGCFVDSLSSDLGVLSRRAPYDPFRRRSVPAGVSGGMSPLGSGAALLASAAIALGSALALELRPATALWLGGLVFLQSLADSLLGSLLQIKYRCSVCGTLTDHGQHCDAPALRESGCAWIDNNMVNLLSSILTVLLAASVFAARSRAGLL
ncbi:MAG: DUF92 domain-containing protein [Oscillospiraceae bacterium]|nr:DUF92 domain-containing protein [Oscillospiraceae bacterium]